MQVRLSHDAPLSVRAGALVVPFFSDNTLEGVTKDVDCGARRRDRRRAGVRRNARPARRARARLRQRRSRIGAYSRCRSANAPNSSPTFSRAMREPPCGISAGATSKRSPSLCPRRHAASEATAASFVAEGAITGAFDTTLYQEQPERRIATTTVDDRCAGFRPSRTRARHRARDGRSAKPSTSRDDWPSRPPTT